MMKPIFILLLVSMTLISCEKVIDIDLNESEPKLVIFATYAHHLNRIFVQVSETSSYFNDDPSPVIKDVSIQFQDKSGVVLASTTDGEGAKIEYKQVIAYAEGRVTRKNENNNFFTDGTINENTFEREGFEVEIPPLTPGEKYTVKVTYKGTTYYASSTLFEKVTISKAVFVEKTSLFNRTTTEGGGIDYNIDVTFLDDENEKNYYLIKYKNLNNFVKKRVENSNIDAQNPYPKSLLEPGNSDYEYVLVKGQDFYNPVMTDRSIRTVSDVNRPGEELKYTVRTSILNTSLIGEDRDNKIAITEVDFENYKYLSEWNDLISGGRGRPTLSTPGNPRNVWYDAANDKITDVLGYFNCVNYAYKDAVFEN